MLYYFNRNYIDNKAGEKNNAQENPLAN